MREAVRGDLSRLRNPPIGRSAAIDGRFFATSARELLSQLLKTQMNSKANWVTLLKNLLIL